MRTWSAPLPASPTTSTASTGPWGTLAAGMGTSEVRLGLGPRRLAGTRGGDLAVSGEGELPLGVTAKDVALWLIGPTGMSFGPGHRVESRGSTMRGVST